jgi:hypothetical protein
MKMIMKNNLKKLRQVGICVWGFNGLKFSNAKKSITFRAFDTTPDEVLKVIQKALEDEAKK